jgi:hypothetical protein
MLKGNPSADTGEMTKGQGFSAMATGKISRDLYERSLQGFLLKVTE